MNHRGLQIRMAIVGFVLFVFYLVVASILIAGFGWPPTLVGVGLLAVIGLQYFLGTKLALIGTGAEDMPDEGEFARLHRSVEDMCEEMDLDKPRLMVAEMGVPNAFATGRRGAGTVVVSRELLAVLDFDEVEGVVAHELAHIDNRDSITMTIGQSLGMIVGYLAYIVVAFSGRNRLAGIILGMLAATLAKTLVMIFVMAISRYREYVADADAAAVIGGGDPLADALEKIQRGAQATDAEVRDDVAALCIFGGAETLLSTHPPTEKRIERLRSY